MKVYRYLSEYELFALLANDKAKLGASFLDGYTPNNHRYKKNEKYLHFFLNKDSIANMKKLRKDSISDYYIATFNIPIFTLIRFRGKGIYEDPKGGYDNDTNFLIEFAIPVTHFNTSSLISYELDEHHHEKVLTERSLLKPMHFNSLKDLS